MKKFLTSFMYASRGFVFALKNERNFKVQVVIGIAALVAGMALKIEKSEFLLILIIFPSIISLEMINSAVEKLIDHIHPDFHNEIKVVKDLLAGSVLFSSIISIIVGIVIFIPKLVSFL